MTKWAIFVCLTVCLVDANIFKGIPDSSPVTDENAEKVRNALLSVLVCNSGAFSIQRLLTVDNVVFSPLSISNVLGALYLGSKEGTAAEFEVALGFNSTFLHDGLSTIRKSMMEDMEECDSHALIFANAIAFCDDHSINEDYERESSFYYSNDILPYPNTSDSVSAIDKMNSWVSKLTKGRITSMVSELPEFSSMTVLNALYFKAPWKYPFDPEKTTKKIFYSYGYKATEVEMMLRTVKTLYGYHPDVDSFVLELPYSGLDVDAVFFLPRQRSGLHKLETLMNIDVFNTLHQVMYNTEVEIAVPKLKLSTTIDLSRILSSIGLESLFTSRADLSGIDPDNKLYVSQIVHETMFEFTESGTEAASSTRATIQTLSLKPTFYLNHPFMFLVKHKWTGAILFLGRVQYV